MILEPKNTIKGDFIAPKSKSFAIRAAIAAFLAKKQIRLKDFPKNTDSLAAVKLIHQLSGTAEFDCDDLIVQGDGVVFPDEIFCGESGFCLNIALALALQSKKAITLTGDKTLTTRNLFHIAHNLEVNKIQFWMEKDKLPLTIYPDQSLKYYHIDGSQSSQLASGLLIASIYNPSIRFNVKTLVSQSYFEMTRKLLSDFGYATNVDIDIFSLIKTAEPPETYEIEGDYSGAANILAAAAISGEIAVRGLNPNSLQSDKVLIEVLKRFGADVSFSENILRVKSREMNNFSQWIEDCPDLFPILCVLAAYANGKSIITGITRLMHKESSRAIVMAEELRKAGVDIRLDLKTAIIQGGKNAGADFSSHNDHRIAMALTIFSLFASSSSTLSEPECVEKSYPDFFSDLGII